MWELIMFFFLLRGQVSQFVGKEGYKWDRFFCYFCKKVSGLERYRKNEF